VIKRFRSAMRANWWLSSPISRAARSGSPYDRLPMRRLRLGGGGRGDPRGDPEGGSPTPLGRITFWLSR